MYLSDVVGETPEDPFKAGRVILKGDK